MAIFPISERAKTGEERLMLSVLVQQILDYVNNGDYHARQYLFEDGPQSEEYAFGFRHICQYFSYQAAYIRGLILEMRARNYRIKARRIRKG